MFGLGSRKQPRCLRDPSMTEQSTPCRPTKSLPRTCIALSNSILDWCDRVGGGQSLLGDVLSTGARVLETVDQYACMQVSPLSQPMSSHARNISSKDRVYPGDAVWSRNIFIFFFPECCAGKLVEVRYGGLIGIVFAIGMILQVVGLESISASRSGILTQSVSRLCADRRLAPLQTTH